MIPAQSYALKLPIKQTSSHPSPTEIRANLLRAGLGCSGLIWARYSMVITPVKPPCYSIYILTGYIYIFLVNFTNAVPARNIGRGLSRGLSM